MSRDRLYSDSDDKFSYKRSGAKDLYSESDDKFSYKRRATGGPLVDDDAMRATNNTPPMRKGGSVKRKR